ncbi:hypothetical protein M0805_003646 [Coniferiporia weirii]|nr:hypothetical protein M0805_003646 [Coniferiporia weirii]
MARKKTLRSQLDSPLKNRIAGAIIGGAKIAKVSRDFGVPWSTCKDVYTRLLEARTTHNKPRSGRPRKLSMTAHRRLIWLARKNRRMSLQALGQAVSPKISARTVKRELEHAGLHHRRARRAPFLTKRVKKLRMEVARELRGLTMKELKHVIYSDESYVYLGARPGSVYVTRAADEAYSDECTVPTFSQSSVCVMVWGCIMHGEKGPLVVLDYPGGRGGGMSAEKYQDQVLDGPFLHFYTQMSKGNGSLRFQQDNARCHTAKSTLRWFERAGIPLLPHPPSSPDLNAIEHCWRDLKEAVQARAHPPTSISELKQAVFEAWEGRPLWRVNKYIESIPRRMDAVIKAHGGNTKY